MDGTLIQETKSIWETIFKGLGCPDEERDYGIRMYKEGKFSYSDWAYYDLDCWKRAGAKKEKIMDAIAGVKLTTGVKETLKTLKKHGLKLAVISGGLSIALEKVIPDYRDYFDDIFINSIAFDSKGIPQEIIVPFDSEKKDFQLRMLAEKEKILLEECVFIGDHDNDVHACQIAGLSIAFCPNSEELKKICKVVIEEKDMRKILPFILNQ